MIEATTDMQLQLLVVLNGFDSMVIVRVIVLVPEANIGPVVCQSALEYKRQNIQPSKTRHACNLFFLHLVFIYQTFLQWWKT